MPSLIGFKIFLALIAVLLSLWNYFWRDSFNLPYLSGLSSFMVYLVAGGLLLATIILNWTIREHY